MYRLHANEYELFIYYSLFIFYLYMLSYISQKLTTTPSRHPYKMTLKSTYLVKSFTFCNVFNTAGCLKLISEKCPFFVHF
jgi:hypothetical protein